MDVVPHKPEPEERLEAARRQFMDIVAEYDDPELDQSYERDPEGVLIFVGVCQLLGHAHCTHPPEETDLQWWSNQLEVILGLPRRVSHEIRRHCAA